MQYMILIYGNEQSLAQRTEADMKARTAEWAAYTQEIVSSGMKWAGAQLKPTSTATTLREKNGKVISTDGPFAETKEQLGGYYLIDAPDLDSALAWAKKCPGTRGGSVEVRPVYPSPGR